MNLFPDLDAGIDALNLDEREWFVLEQYVNYKHTLKDISDQLGLTRERIRQIKRNAILKLEGNLFQVECVINILDANSAVLGDPVMDENCTRDGMVDVCRNLLQEKEHQVVSLQNIEKLFLVIRTLVDWKRNSIEIKWPQISYAVCALSPIIDKHAGVAEAIKKKRELERMWTYPELARYVLEEAGRPLHWREIVDRAAKLDKRQNINTSAMYNTLLKRDLFVRTDSGTYGLAEWGLSEPVDYPEIIASVMKKYGKLMTFGKIYQHVNMVRAVKKSSLQMFLDMHPRFYRSEEGVYGLRGWLPPRDQQTLRTPKWLREPLDSYERVQRAIRRGYHVADMISADKGSIRSNGD